MGLLFMNNYSAVFTNIHKFLTINSFILDVHVRNKYLSATFG